MASTANVNSRFSVAAKSVDVLVALAAIFVTWSTVQPPEPFFKVPPEYHLPELGPSQEKYQRYLEQQYRVDYQNAAVVIGMMGAMMGAGFAICRCAKTALPARIVIGGIIGFCAGAAAGALGCYLQILLSRENQLPRRRNCKLA